MNVVLTGSHGYVGTATKELLEKRGYKVIEIDKKNKRNTKRIYSYLTREKTTCIIHLSAKKSIPESIQKPLSYYFNNLISTFVVAVVARVLCIPVVFASSAAVYCPSNPYAKCKMLEEWLLRLLCPKLAILRYFNIVGKTQTVRDEKSTNIFSIISQQSKININNINSKRDYVHVLDIARANVLAMEYIQNNKYLITDIFTGKQRTMINVINEYKKQGYNIKYTVLGVPDVSIFPYIDNRSIIGWKPKYTFSQAIESEVVYDI